MGFINWEKHHKKIADIIVNKTNLNTDPVYGKKFKKFSNWWLYKFPPIFTYIIEFLVLIWFFKRIRSGFGMEYLFIIVSVIIIFTLRGIQKEVSQSNKK